MITAGDAIQAMAALPIAPLSAVTGDGPVLILAPHPDDETLGCGGLIAAAVVAGHAPFVLILTDGTGSHPNSRTHAPNRLRSLREQETLVAAAVLGLPGDRVGFLGLRDTAAPTSGVAFEQAVASVASLARHIGAQTMIAPWEHDPHCDHVAAHLMAVAAAARCGIGHLAYPVWGWTLPYETALPGALPTGMRLDIAAHLEPKRRAIQAHASQYGGLIKDDPTGFQLPPGLLDVFSRPFETFLMIG